MFGVSARAAFARTGFPRAAAFGARSTGNVAGAPSKQGTSFLAIGSVLALGAGMELYRKSSPAYPGLLAEEQLKGILSGPEPKILVWGETGEGKSTLINAFKDPEEKVAPTGRNSNGNTSDIGMYKGTIGDKKVIFIDMPGIGSRNMPFTDFMRAFQKSLSSVDGVIVCSKVDKNRITLGTQLVQTLVDKCITGQKKWDNIIFCGTQADRCSKEEIDDFRSSMKDEFNEKIEGSSLSRVVVVSQSENHGGYVELRSELQKLPERKLECYVHRSNSGSLLGSFLQNSM